MMHANQWLVGSESKEAKADLEATNILLHLQNFGLLEDGGRWKNWNHTEETRP